MKLQKLREFCKEEDIDYSALHRKKDLSAKINEVREARQAVVDDDVVENSVVSHEDVASDANQSASQSGITSCGQV